MVPLVALFGALQSQKILQVSPGPNPETIVIYVGCFSVLTHGHKEGVVVLGLLNRYMNKYPQNKKQNNNQTFSKTQKSYKKKWVEVKTFSF